jgi:ketosteroid isomerase-like protein
MSDIFDPLFLDALYPAFERGDPQAAAKTVEAQNLRLVESIYRMIAQADFDTLRSVFAEGIELEIVGPSGAPMVGTKHGASEVIEAIKSNFALLQDQCPEIESVVAQGNSVVVMGRETGRFRATGQPYELRWVHEFTLEDGRLGRVREMFDTAAMMAAANATAEGQA